MGEPEVSDLTYGFTVDPLTLTPGYFTTIPVGCPVIYSCETILPVGGVDLCTISSDYATTFFDTATGVLQVIATVATEIPSFPLVPEYQVKITGTFGIQQSNTFTIVVYNPCLNNVPGEDYPLSVAEGIFPDQYTHYVIESPTKHFAYNRLTIGYN